MWPGLSLLPRPRMDGVFWFLTMGRVGKFTYIIYIYIYIYTIYIYIYIYTYTYTYIYIYSSLKDFWSSYRKLTWVRFEPTTTEFCSDALTDWDIRPWVQLALIAKFVRLLQFHLFVQCSHFILAIVFASCYICFKRYLSQIITLVAEWIDTYSIPHWKIFEVAIESWSEWDFKPQPLNSVQIK